MRSFLQRSKHDFIVQMDSISTGDGDVSKCSRCGLMSLSTVRETALVAFSASPREPRVWVVPEEVPPCRRRS